MMIWFSLIISVLLVSWTSGLPTSDEKPQVCDRKGRLSNPKDCGSYYECMEDDFARRLLPFERFCPNGLSFNSSSEGCGKTLNVTGCNAQKGRTFTSNPKYKYLCKDKSYSTSCIDCQTVVSCTEGHAYASKCESNLRCIDNSPDFDGSLCHTHFDDQCRCTSPNSYRRDPFTNSTFFSCEAENAVPTYYNCLHGMFFDEITKTCVNNDGSPACTTSGLFTFPENCAKYYSCSSALEGWVKKKLSCPDKQLFNQETGTCEDPCNWELKEFKCKIQGRFKNKKDCQRFNECINGGDGSLLAMERYCPPGFHFYEENKTCVVRALSSCKLHNDSNLKLCKKDFLAICKTKQKIIPATVPIGLNVGKKPESGKRPDRNLAKGEPIKGTLVQTISVAGLPKKSPIQNSELKETQ